MMIPFQSVHFFGYLLVLLVPAVIFGIFGITPKLRSIWVLISTVIMIGIIMRPYSLLLQVVGYFIFEWIIVRSYLAYRKSGRNRSLALYFAVILSILPLIIVKVNLFLGVYSFWKTPFGFLGISYLTFRLVGTIFEIRDGLIKKISFFHFISYVLFFPTLASGPIDRYRRFVDDLLKPLSSKEYAIYLADGLDSFFKGILYKFVIAYLIHRYWLTPAESLHGLKAIISYMYAYGFYLFFDFAGYSAFAIGVSNILGIKTPENFNKPFFSKNIKDFWNRWHMSLSFWFRDYIYLRFVLATTKKKRFKNRYTSAYIGYLILFGIMGIWHGLQLQYIAYGLYHAILMIGYDYLERLNKTRQFWRKSVVWNCLGVFCTFQFVMFGLLIFSGRII